MRVCKGGACMNPRGCDTAGRCVLALPSPCWPALVTASRVVRVGASVTRWHLSKLFPLHPTINGIVDSIEPREHMKTTYQHGGMQRRAHCTGCSPRGEGQSFQARDQEANGWTCNNCGEGHPIRRRVTKQDTELDVLFSQLLEQ